MNVYFIAQFNSPVGKIVAIADKNVIIWLQFLSEDKIHQALLEYKKDFNCELLVKFNLVLLHLEKELKAYFQGDLYNFSVPYKIISSSIFQQQTWSMVSCIPYGQTQSYKEIAQKLNKSLAVRAVGNANARNPVMLLIPCHRVIQANKKIGGYAGGVSIKQWLLDHEARIR